MGRTKRKIIQNPKDLYRTPQWCINILARVIHESLPVPYWVGDLGAGDGRIGITVASQWKQPPKMWFNDLKLDIDLKKKEDEKLVFCDEDNLLISKPPKQLNDKRVIYVSNPPFSLDERFVDWGVRRIALAPQGSVAIFLLQKNWFGSKGRAFWINQHPPNRIVGLAPRPSFRSDGATAFAEYCWAFWYYGNMKSVFWPERIEIKKGK